VVAGVHKELIAEARMNAAYYGDTDAGPLLVKLADALEASEPLATVECHVVPFGWIACPEPDTCGNPKRTIRMVMTS